MNEQQRPDPNSPEWAAYWQSQIDQAQNIATYIVNNTLCMRVRYGQECDDLRQIAEHQTCHDCGIHEGQLHVPGCDVEQCPACEGQAISCNCRYEDNSPISDEREVSHELKRKLIDKWYPIIPRRF